MNPGVYKPGSQPSKENKLEDIVRQELRSSIEVKRSIDEELISGITRAARAIIESLKSGGKVILFGNGGSAADAQHIACELVGKLQMDRSALPAIALTTNTSILTAVGNDSDFSAIFSRQLDGLGNSNDVVVAISTSGNSPNVLEAVKVARQKGIATIGFTGASGDNLCKLTDLCLRVPSTDTPRIQEVHITIGHIICSLVEKELFGSEK